MSLLLSALFLLTLCLFVLSVLFAFGSVLTLSRRGNGSQALSIVSLPGTGFIILAISYFLIEQLAIDTRTGLLGLLILAILHLAYRVRRPEFPKLLLLSAVLLPLFASAYVLLLVALPAESFLQLTPLYFQTLFNLPIDNLLLLNGARYFIHDIPFSSIEIVPDWSFYERTPLASLALAAILELIGGLPTGSWLAPAVSEWIVSLVVICVFNTLSTLVLLLFWNRAQSTSSLVVAFATFVSTPFFLINTTFSWPKLLMAYFVIVGLYSLLVKSRSLLGVIFLIAGYLTHPSAIFAIVTFCIVCIGGKRLGLTQTSLGWRQRILAPMVLVLSVVSWGKWAALQGTSGTRMFSFHFFCQLDAKTATSTSLLAQAKSYFSSLSLLEHIELRIANLLYPINPLLLMKAPEAMFVRELGHLSFFQVLWTVSPFLLLSLLLFFRNIPRDIKPLFVIALLTWPVAALSFGCMHASKVHHWAYPLLVLLIPLAVFVTPVKLRLLAALVFVLSNVLLTANALNSYSSHATTLEILLFGTIALTILPIGVWMLRRSRMHFTIGTLSLSSLLVLFALLSPLVIKRVLYQKSLSLKPGALHCSGMETTDSGLLYPILESKLRGHYPPVFALKTNSAKDSLPGAYQLKQRLYWGHAGDYIFIEDIDGDEVEDVIALTPANGNWRALLSKCGFDTIKAAANVPGCAKSWQWGLSGDEPFFTDIDGDGLADSVMVRAEGTKLHWYIRYAEERTEKFSFGEHTDRPLVFDVTSSGSGELGLLAQGGQILMRSGGVVSEKSSVKARKSGKCRLN